MDEGDMYESEVITFVAPKKSGWLKKKSTGEQFGSSGCLFVKEEFDVLLLEYRRVVLQA